MSPLLAAPPHSPSYPSVPIPSSLHCYMICSESSLEGGPPPPPPPLAPLLQVAGGISFLAPSPSCRRHSSRFHSPRSLPFCLPLILFPLMWGLSFSSSLAGLGAPKLPPLCLSLPLFCFSSRFILSSAVHPLGDERVCVLGGKKGG